MTGAVCIASGPSLTLHDIILCAKTGREMYVVNDVYRLAPFAHHLYAGDSDWWDHHEGATSFMGERYCPDPRTCERWGLNHVPATSSKVFATELPLATGGNSGFQALNLAFLHGHRDIWLLGYDMGFEAGTPKHFFGEHDRRINRTSNYPDWLDRFAKAKPLMDDAGLKVINMSRKTALECFERWNLCDYT